MLGVGDVEVEDLGDGRTTLHVPEIIGELPDGASGVLVTPTVYAVTIHTDMLDEVLAGGWPVLMSCICGG